MQNGIIWCKFQEGFEVFVNGEIIGFHLVEAAALRMFKRAGGTLPEPQATPPLALPVALPAAPVIASQRPTQRETAGRARCAWYRAIRRAYGCAVGAGLDTKADVAMRAAIGALLGRAVATRSDLTAGEWLSVGDAVKLGALSW